MLFSRARDGMYVLGNTVTFSEAKNSKGRALWTRIITKLSAEGRIVNGFPALCTCHKKAPNIPLSSAELFAAHVPDGGCTRQCGVLLPSCPLGHCCPKKCHPKSTVADHAPMQCMTVVVEQCVNGHDVERICCQSEAKPCRQIVVDSCAKGHKFSRNCYSKVIKQCDTCRKIQQVAEEARRLELKKLTAHEDALVEAERGLVEAQAALASEKRISEIEKARERAARERLLAERELKRLQVSGFESV